MPRDLGASVLPVESVTASMRSEMFALFRRHYEDVTPAIFGRDLDQKHRIVVLRDSRNVLRGFSTLATCEQTVAGRRIRLLFSGDTIVDPAYWGEHVLGRAWSELAGAIRSERPEIPLYWLLLSKGYRTYLYLPLFFHEFFPSCERGTPVFDKAVIDAFASSKYGPEYNPASGVVEFGNAPGRLRADLADVPPHRAGHPHVRFFLAANPRYREGHELVCLARLDASNMRGYAHGHFLRGEAAAGRSAEAAG